MDKIFGRVPKPLTEKIQLVNTMRYLGVKITAARLTNELFNLDNHLKTIFNKIYQAKNQVLALKDYSTTKQAAILYNNLFSGNFQHGLECQPLLPTKVYTKFQEEYCKVLKIIVNKTFHQTKEKISYNQLLSKYKFRSVLNNHKYLALHRIHKVLVAKKPVNLYNLLKDNIMDSFESIPVHYKDKRVPFAIRKRQYLAQAVGKYDVKMYHRTYVAPTIKKKIPAKKKFLELSKKFAQNLLDQWPFCFSTIFNELPQYLRAQIGGPFFQRELKSYFNNRCQHPPSFKEYCKECQPIVHSDRFWELMYIKSWSSCHEKQYYSSTPDFLNKTMLLLFHPVFQRAFQKFNAAPNWDRLFLTYPFLYIWDMYIVSIDEFYD